jgi:DNA-binding NarL/FixJ family response regulator
MRIVIADDSALLREGVARILADAGHDVVGICGDGEALMLLVAELAPDVAVVDVRMPPSHTTEGLQAAAAIRARHPGTGVLLLSQHVETAHLADLLAAGGRGLGYLLKDRITELADFLEAVQRVAEGRSVVDPDVVARLMAKGRRDDRLATITDRERGVLSLMAEGKSNASIAATLVLSERTVEAHIRSILTRLGIDAGADTHRRVLAVLEYLRAV